MAEIGIVGGTFDPIHNGHLLLGQQAYEEYGLDEIWFMPSPRTARKADHVTDVENRCEMVRRAIDGVPYFKLSRLEADREGIIYTADTLSLLCETFREHRFYFVMGADLLYQIRNWYHPELVMQQAVLLVAGRECRNAVRSMDDQIRELTSCFHADIRRLHCEELAVSSGCVRDMWQHGFSIEPYVPKAVEQYIAKQGLYSAGAMRCQAGQL